MFAVILLALINFLVDSYPDFQDPVVDFVTRKPAVEKIIVIDTIEAFSIAVFTIDYIIRLVMTKQLRSLLIDNTCISYTIIMSLM